MKAGIFGLMSMSSLVVAMSIVISACGSSEDVITSSHGPTPSPTYKNGTVPIPVGPPNASVIANELLTPEPGPPTCGPWSAADGSLGSVVEAQYGEMRNCGFFDGYWVITTLGLKQSDGTRHAGVIGVYPCNVSESACLEENSDHVLSGWSFVSPPHAGGLTILGHPVSGQINLDNGGYQLLFDLASHTFPSPTQDTTTVGQ